MSTKPQMVKKITRKVTTETAAKNLAVSTEKNDTVTINKD